MPIKDQPWCSDNWCAIETLSLPNSVRCVSAVVWEHRGRSAKQHGIILRSSSIRCFKRSTSSSAALAECREWLSCKLPLLNWLKECCAVGTESVSSGIVVPMFLGTCIALWGKVNCWSRSTRRSLHDKLICDCWYSLLKRCVLCP